MFKGIEYRALTGDATANDSGTIHGVAAPFGKPAMIGETPWGFRESISPGAFTKTINEADVVLLVNHDSSMPVARSSAGTLTLRQTDKGLEYEAAPADTSYARDLVANIRSGNVAGNSFGFNVVKDEWAVGADGVDERTIHELKLVEISACTFPAYADTELSVRDMCEAAREHRAKYTAEQLRQMLAKGQALKNANGDPSFPIADGEDLSNAIRAVGRAGIDGDKVRKYIMGRAKALGMTDKIPDTWNSDGSLKREVQDGDGEFRDTGELTDDDIRASAAAIDAALDEAWNHFTDEAVNRDSLPACVNQGIDLVKSALVTSSVMLEKSGGPDPDHPNGNSYVEPDNSTPVADDGDALTRHDWRFFDADLQGRKPL
jgi:HK97 family phage prohead protease